MSRILFIKIVIIGLVLSSVCFGYSGGSGTLQDPYQIATKADLLTLAATVADHNKCFILTADIDLENQVFTTAIIAANIGSSGTFRGTAFTGVLDGNGHKIDNFTINGGNNQYLGLFGRINYGGSVKNLGLENCAVSGCWFVGGLVGENYGGIITNCYSTSTVSGLYYVGGLVGKNWFNINSCYSTGSVSGTADVGGLVGTNDGIISNCYSVNDVSGSSGVGGLLGSNCFNYGVTVNCYSAGSVSGSSYVGGLIGFNDGSVISSYFLVGTGPDNGYGKPLTDEQMKQQASFTGWDFLGETANGTCNYWHLPEDSYPVLATFSGHVPPQVTGSGTEENPYIIADANDLGTIWFRPLAYYVLAGDINLSGITWSISVVPVFGGVFDGNGFIINNLFISGVTRLGLFGMSYPGSQIKNLGLENCTVIGTGFSVGGLVGYSDDGIISNCYSTGDVNGSYVGGLVGQNSGGIICCYSKSEVSGNKYVGGLVGYNGYGNISNCYSTGAVSGTSDVGGLIGRNHGSIVSSFWDIETSGQTTSAGGTGKMTAEMQTKSTFTSAGWDFTTPVWTIKENIDYPRLRWENSIPVADAGPNQVAYAWIDGFADVNLDGFASYDDDNDVLDYYWSWIIGGNICEANGVNPTIELPVGKHTIELVVDDGIDLSQPDYCTITIIRAIRGSLIISPRVIEIKSCGRWIIATLFIPPVPGEQINKNEPLRLYPSGIEAKYQRFRRYGFSRCAPSFAIAFFDKQQVVDALGTGWFRVNVVGEFLSGRFFFGSDVIRIATPKPPPRAAAGRFGLDF